MRTGGITTPDPKDLESAIVRIHVLQDEAKRLLGLLNEQEQSAKLLVQRDLALTKANEKLERLDHAKSEFVSVAAHQLRTPLSGIKWGLNILIEGEAGELSDDQKDIIRKSISSNDRMIVLVNDLLDVDHIEAEKDHYTFEELDLRQVIESVISDLKARIAEVGVTVTFKNRYDDYPKVRADRAKIRAVVQNLLENAVRYGEKGGTVKIVYEESGDSMMKVTVEDDGIGIAKEQQEKIFTKFFRADNAVKHRTDGSGLGLFIARDIVKKHGGMIWFRSEKDQGTTFYFTIPKAH